MGLDGTGGREEAARVGGKVRREISSSPSATACSDDAVSTAGAVMVCAYSRWTFFDDPPQVTLPLSLPLAQAVKRLAALWSGVFRPPR